MANGADELVRDWMTTDVSSLKETQPVSEAVELLLKKKVKSAPVVDEDGHLLGLISEADLIASETEVHIPTMISILGEVAAWPPSILRFRHDVERSSALTVSSAMSKEVQTASPDQSISEIAGILYDNKIVMVPVVESGKVIGVIGRSDILRCMAAPNRA